MRRAQLAAALTVAASLVLSGCGGLSPLSSGETTTLLSGPAHAEIADPDIAPITSSPKPQLPVTVKSYDGQQVTVHDVSRIIAVDLYGTLGEIVYSLGLGPHVVGRDVSTGFPQAAAVPVVTSGGHDLNAEAILDLNPTVVLTDTSIGPPEVQAQLRKAGIPVVFFDPDRTLDGVGRQVRAVAAALGVAAEGSALAERVSKQITEAKERVPSGITAPRIAFLYVRGSAGVYLLGGPGSGADSLIESVGGVDVGTAIGLKRSFVTITSEELIEAAPDVLLVMTDGLKSVRGIDGLLKLAGVAQTPAAQNRRVIDMPDTEMLSFGARSGEVVQALATALYPAE